MANPFNQVATFVRESKEELKKVTWPEREEVTSFTVVVIVAVLFMAFFLWIVDSILMKLITAVMY